MPLAYASATFRFGREAVLIFFALSGFFIHSTAASRLAAGQDVGFNAGRFLQRRARRPAAPIAVVVFLLALAGYLTVPSLQLKALCAAAFAIAAVYAFATASVRPDRLGVRLLEYLGKRSFSIYIFHFPCERHFLHRRAGAAVE